ncbi:uncharacterized protein LOC124359464 [Homalodisca vitripennis]|uniref:uncharacterized protein LOC124359464 n=1 Tax=Homalodisca vitripennis TaxID=197043 RepID=UPI001EEAB223|nr:uncharacterized protein LOC124359464 [Homalodisca vitripennis]
MIPLLICIPFLTQTTPGYTCSIPSHHLLTVLSIVFIALMLPIVTINTVDAPHEFTIGYLLMMFLVSGMLLFVSLGYFGMRKRIALMLRMAFWIWFLTWIGFLTICIFSVWNSSTLKYSSINGRCPLTLWIFDWCFTAKHMFPRPRVENTSISLVEDKEMFLNDLTTEQQTVNINLPNFDEITINIDHFKSIEGNVNVTREKRSITEVGVPANNRYGPEYRAAVERYLGIFFMMLSTMALFTLYGITIQDLLVLLTWPPVFFIVRPQDLEQPSAENGTNTQSRTN